MAINIRSLVINDLLWCQTGGERSACTVFGLWNRGYVKELKDCVLVTFDNGNRQWMDSKFLSYRDRG